MTPFEEFEQYLENRLSPEERAAFEQRLQQDAELASEFGLYRTLQTDMQQWQSAAGERIALKQTLQRITGRERKTAKVVPLRRYLWRVAAMTILVVSLWQLFRSRSAGKPEQELYATYITEGNISLTRGDAPDSLFAAGARLFNNGQFDKAIAPFNTYIQNGYDSGQLASVLTAYCYLRTNNDSAAANILALKFPPGEAQERARWYKALLLLKKEQKEECRAQLKAIAASESAYRQKAAALLKSLH